MVHKMGLMEDPIKWETTSDEKPKMEFDPQSSPAKIMHKEKPEQFEAMQHMKLTEQFKQNNDDMKILNDGKGQLFSPQWKDKAEQKMDDLKDQNMKIQSNLKKMEDDGRTPPPSTTARLQLQEQASRLNQGMEKLTRLADDIGLTGGAIHRPAIKKIYQQLQAVNQKLAKSG